MPTVPFLRSRSAQRGALIGLVVPLLLSPFLMMAGWAFKNFVEQSVRPMAGDTVARLVGLAALLPYVVVVYGIPTILGGTIGFLIGSFINSVKARS